VEHKQLKASIGRARIKVLQEGKALCFPKCKNKIQYYCLSNDFEGMVALDAASVKSGNERVLSVRVRENARSLPTFPSCYPQFGRNDERLSIGSQFQSTLSKVKFKDNTGLPARQKR